MLRVLSAVAKKFDRWYVSLQESSHVFCLWFLFKGQFQKIMTTFIAILLSMRRGVKKGPLSAVVVSDGWLPAGAAQTLGKSLSSARRTSTLRQVQKRNPCSCPLHCHFIPRASWYRQSLYLTHRKPKTIILQMLYNASLIYTEDSCQLKGIGFPDEYFQNNFQDHRWLSDQ